MVLFWVLSSSEKLLRSKTRQPALMAQRISILLHWLVLMPVLLLFSQRIDVFKGGSDGYACYRIPSLLLTLNKTLIAFAEGRKYSCNDHGYVDLVYKHSTDFGATWSNLTLLYSNSSSQTNYNTIGNPAPVQDRDTGTIWMIFSKNNKAIYASYSVDDGRTFGVPPQPLNTINTAQNWTWVATGPPSGLQLENGRLIVPFDWSVAGMYATKGYLALSDDHGHTWNLSEQYFGTDEYWPNESQAVQLQNGSILINSRTGKNDSWYRLASLSDDNGNSWKRTSYVQQLRDTQGGCEGSMIMSKLNGNLYYAGLTPSAQTSQRTNLTLHVSVDQGNNWKFFATVESGSSAYSSLVDIPSKREIGVLYERDSYGFISFNTWSY